MVFSKQTYWIPVLISFAVGVVAEDFRVEDQRQGMYLHGRTHKYQIKVDYLQRHIYLHNYL